MSAAAAQRCLAAVLKETARRSGGESLEAPGLLLVAGADPCPMFVNGALRTGPLAAGELLDRAAEFFARRGYGYETWTRDGVDADLEAAALRRGMRLAAALTAMVATGSPTVARPAAATELRPVVDAAGIADFIAVVAEGFQHEAPGIADLVSATFREPRMLLAADTAAFVVSTGGEPAAAAMTMVCGGVAWIGWVATRDAFRGRGLGTLATAAATRAGFGMGARLASLEATAAGAGAYARLGFREVARYRTYWPESVPAWPPPP